MTSFACWTWFLPIWLALLTPASAAGETVSPTAMEKVDYHGWHNSWRLANAGIEVTVVTDIGPRILDLRIPGGPNLLQHREGIGGSEEATYQFRGGWRLWVAPERKETTYDLDNSACDVEPIGSSTLRITGPPQINAGIRKIVEIGISDHRARVRIVSRIRNISTQPVTYAAWSLPVLAPGGRAFLPLDVGPLDAFDATRQLILWSYARFSDPRYVWGDRLIQIDHSRIPVAGSPSGGRQADESKIGVDSRQGWSAYLLDRTLLLKRFPFQAGEYVDGAATMEVYSSGAFLELDHLGPLTTIPPGGEISLPEEWWLFSPVAIATGEAAALADLGPYLDRSAPGQD